ncbi:hypothetical protein P9209_29290 [Prescottella defluvii]|nr:hypothetical protein P9209_29290 [Prescottella defluvii]
MLLPDGRRADMPLRDGATLGSRQLRAIAFRTHTLSLTGKVTVSPRDSGCCTAAESSPTTPPAVHTPAEPLLIR